MTTLFVSNHKQRHQRRQKSHQRNVGPWNIQSSHLSVKEEMGINIKVPAIA